MSSNMEIAIALCRMTEVSWCRASQAAGEFQMSQTVSLQQGLRARSGIDSAELAKAGFDAPKEALYGRYGFFRAFEPVQEQNLLIGKLGVDFIGRDLSYKPLICCKCIHPAISAILRCRSPKVLPVDAGGAPLERNS